MRNWLSELSLLFKVSILSLIVTIVSLLALLFGYFINQPDLPNGLLAGGFLGSLSYLLLGIAERIDEKKKTPVWTIVFTIIRFVLIGSLLVVAALLQFKYEYKAINVFTVLGGYMISLVVYIILMSLEKKHV